MTVKKATTTHKTVHKTVHKSVHKATHKTTVKKPVVHKAKVARKVGTIVPEGLLLNDRANTCALLAWWTACVSVFGNELPTPDDWVVSQVYAELGGGDDTGLYLESVLARAMRPGGLFGYQLLDPLASDGILIGTSGAHAYAGDEAYEMDLDEVWLLGVVIG